MVNASSNSASNNHGEHRNLSNEVKQNNFIPSSNLSQFLLKKGSNGSLHTFENEYSYKINLNNLNPQSMQQQSSGKTSKKVGGAKKNHLFKEVIVEDEAEDMRVSQMGQN